MPAKSRVAPELHLGLRLAWRGHLLFGPGKAELLAGIDRTGSISRAARRMKMSYMKAWLLIQHMEKRIRTPLVRTTRGGTAGGGAALTPAGRALVAAYQAMEADCQRGARKHLRRIARLIEAT